jgi:hypothetical protein
MAHSGSSTSKQYTRKLSTEKDGVERKIGRPTNGSCDFRYTDDGHDGESSLPNSSSIGHNGWRSSQASDDVFSGNQERKWEHSREETTGLLHVGGISLRDGRMERGFWGDAEWLPFRDGKQRIVKSSLGAMVDDVTGGIRQGCDLGEQEVERKIVYPLVNKSQDSSKYTIEEIDFDNTPEARTIRIEGYGDAIVAELAAEFIGTSMEWLSSNSPNAV